MCVHCRVVVVVMCIRGWGSIHKKTMYMYAMCRYIENAVKCDGDSDEIVRAKVRTLMTNLGLDFLSEITESIFVRHLSVAYQRDPENTAQATKRALSIMKSQTQKVFDHVRLICTYLYYFAR